MKKEMMLLTGRALAFAATPAMANGGFLRGEFGQADVDLDVDGFGSESDDDGAFSLRGGYFFNEHFAVEGFYSSFYDKSFEVEDGTDTIDVDSDFSGWGVGIVGKTYMTKNEQSGLYFMGRAGIMHSKLELSATGVGSDSDSSNKPYFGVGVGYDFSPSWGISLNWDQTKGSAADGDIDVTARTLAIGLEARF